MCNAILHLVFYKPESGLDRGLRMESDLVPVIITPDEELKFRHRTYR